MESFRYGTESAPNAKEPLGPCHVDGPASDTAAYGEVVGADAMNKLQ